MHNPIVPSFRCQVVARDQATFIPTPKSPRSPLIRPALFRCQNPALADRTRCVSIAVCRDVDFVEVMNQVDRVRYAAKSALENLPNLRARRFFGMPTILYRFRALCVKNVDSQSAERARERFFCERFYKSKTMEEVGGQKVVIVCMCRPRLQHRPRASTRDARGWTQGPPPVLFRRACGRSLARPASDFSAPCLILGACLTASSCVRPTETDRAWL